jgi:hypothetical protein
MFDMMVFLDSARFCGRIGKIALVVLTEQFMPSYSARRVPIVWRPASSALAARGPAKAANSGLRRPLRGPAHCRASNARAITNARASRMRVIANARDRECARHRAVMLLQAQPGSARIGDLDHAERQLFWASQYRRTGHAEPRAAGHGECRLSHRAQVPDQALQHQTQTRGCLSMNCRTLSRSNTTSSVGSSAVSAAARADRAATRGSSQRQAARWFATPSLQTLSSGAAARFAGPWPAPGPPLRCRRSRCAAAPSPSPRTDVISVGGKRQ